MTPPVELAALDRPWAKRTNRADHPCFTHRDGWLVDAGSPVKPRVEPVDGARELLRVLTERCSVGPGGDQMTTRDVEATFEGARESMFVEYVPTLERRLHDAE